MKVVEGLERLQPLPHCVLTVGNFDGVHRAHQRILAQAGLFAANTAGPVVVFTFEPHPLTVVAPDRAPERLTPHDEKLRLLEQTGADLTVIARSDPALLGMEPEDFVRRVLYEKFHPTHIVEGPSFGFGRARRGTPQLLRDVAGPLGAEVHIVEPVTVQTADNETLMVSSSLIRKLLHERRVEPAATCLGRPYALLGRVVRGSGRGRPLGFPTANVQVTDQLIPADGVYAGRAVVGGRAYPAGISIGKTPTFGGADRQIEAHLLDYSGELHDQPLRVEFQAFLRDQQRFDSPEALREQIARDVAEVRGRLSDNGAPSGASVGRTA